MIQEERVSVVTDIGHTLSIYCIGEYQIARAFSRALVSGLNIGSTPLEVPATIPPRPLPKPESFQIYSSTIGVTAIWDKGMLSSEERTWGCVNRRRRQGLMMMMIFVSLSLVFGAYTYDAEYRINGSDTNPPLHFSPTNVRANRWDTHWAVPKDTYVFFFLVVPFFGFSDGVEDLFFEMRLF